VIDRLLKFLGQSRDLPEEECTVERIRHATAVLLVEIARADHELHEHEVAAIDEQLVRCFGIEPESAAELVARARHAAEESVSLHEFTRLLHAEMSYTEKESVVEMLWRIAFADRNLDKYEDYMIAKIAELLYVARGDVIRLRQRVMDSVSGAS
jgi:uncharacterized tellurite resistance protein B-like protein